MGDLPEDRVQPAFFNCGVDFCGLFLTKELKTKDKSYHKSYIAVSVCFTTKVVHLEMVSQLSTNAFLSSLRRFIARRGRCQNIYCDNATNFVGARNQLKVLFNKQAKYEITNSMSKEGIQLNFIHLRTPSFGREAAVKSAKTLLKRVVGDVQLTYEEFLTLIAQIEACLNSRPLTPISSDPNNYLVLTPGHFLIGESLSAIPDPDITNIAENRLTYWQRVQAMVQHFWKRWSIEYLSQLQQIVAIEPGFTQEGRHCYSERRNTPTFLEDWTCHGDPPWRRWCNESGNS